MNPFLMHAILKKAKKNGKINSLPDVNPKNVICIATGIVVIGGAFGLITHIAKEEKQQQVNAEKVEENVEPTIFDEGEHIISVPIEGSLDEKQLVEYHSGYKPIGIASTKYGKAAYQEETCILYVNETPVEAKPSKKDGENYIYEEFGSPIEIDEKKIAEDLYTVDFPAGTHILVVPSDCKAHQTNQYKYHEGYEPIGYTITTEKDGYLYDGKCSVLYINIEDVTVEKDEDNKCINFGTPKEEAKVNIKK